MEGHQTGLKQNEIFCSAHMLTSSLIDTPENTTEFFTNVKAYAES